MASFAGPELGGWYYEISEVGYNYRLTDIQAALGTVPAGEARPVHRPSQRDRRALPVSCWPTFRSSLPPAAPDGFVHGYHLFAVTVPTGGRLRPLRERGIATQVHYVPIHHHPVSADIELQRGDLPVCDEIYDELLSLPMFPDLTDGDVEQVVEILSASLDA
jgi:dTDP-4-amino-4,6-dideoxygalactose transaminase